MTGDESDKRNPRGESDHPVREATTGEIADVMGILDAAMLDVTVDRVRSLIDSEGGAVLLAVEEERILGALVLSAPPDDPGTRTIEAIAVRPGRRGQGIGSALVSAASDRTDGALLARFDAGVRPFYEALGFEIEAIGDGERFRGTLYPTREG